MIEPYIHHLEYGIDMSLPTTSLWRQNTAKSHMKAEILHPTIDRVEIGEFDIPQDLKMQFKDAQLYFGRIILESRRVILGYEQNENKLHLNLYHLSNTIRNVADVWKDILVGCQNLGFAQECCEAYEKIFNIRYGDDNNLEEDKINSFLSKDYGESIPDEYYRVFGAFEDYVCQLESGVSALCHIHIPDHVYYSQTAFEMTKEFQKIGSYTSFDKYIENLAFSEEDLRYLKDETPVESLEEKRVRLAAVVVSRFSEYVVHEAMQKVIDFHKKKPEPLSYPDFPYNEPHIFVPEGYLPEGVSTLDDLKEWYIPKIKAITEIIQ